MVMKKIKLNDVRNDKKAIKINIIMSVLIVAILSFISVGFALYGQSHSPRPEDDPLTAGCITE